LARHAEARGGAEALEAVRSIRVKLHISEPGFEAELLYRAARPEMARVDVLIERQVVFIEGFDGTVAWQQPGPDAPPTIASADGTAALRRGALGNLYALHELQALGHELQLLERTDIDGIRYYAVKVTFDDGEVEHQYMDPESFLVIRERQVHALHPDIDSSERWIESRSSDFRAIDGIVRSFRSADWDLRTGERLQSVEISTIDLNPDLDPAIFAMPAPEDTTP
jgi:hypothetical protein